MIGTPSEQMRQRCWELGQKMPDKVEHKILMGILAKVIVQEKVLDDDAFKMASKAYSEGFNGFKLGELSENWETPN